MNACPYCDTELNVPDEALGKAVRCPACQRIFVAQPEGANAARANPMAERIIVGCDACGRFFRVDERFAGRFVGCPQCASPMMVPGEVVPEVAIAGEFPTAEAAGTAPSTEYASALGGDSAGGWYVQDSQGQQFGPISQEELDGWHREGRLTDEFQVLWEGDSQWRCAGDLFPDLQTVVPPDPAPVAVHGVHAGGPSVLKLTSKRTMANRIVEGAIKKSSRGNRVVQSRVYQVGEHRSLFDRLRDSAVVGGFAAVEKDIRVDLLHVLTVSDKAGEFHVAVPFDNGVPCPVEYISVHSGTLPGSVALLRGEGENWGIALTNSVAGAFVDPVVGKAAEAIGGQPESHWLQLHSQAAPTLWEPAEQRADLKAGFLWDSKLDMGPMSVSYHLEWAVQAVPLDASQYLLVAQQNPKRKMIGFDVGVIGYLTWRDSFLALVGSLAAPAGTECAIYDPGHFYSVATEVLKLPLPG